MFRINQSDASDCAWALNVFSTYFKYFNTMIVLIHTIWHVIAELSLPSWQKDVRNITYDVIEAMKEAKKYETAV